MVIEAFVRAVVIFILFGSAAGYLFWIAYTDEKEFNEEFKEDSSTTIISVLAAGTLLFLLEICWYIYTIEASRFGGTL